MKTSLFDFNLPAERIALHPVRPRDAARLLVASGKETFDRSVRDLPDLLRAGDVMVFNDTRVMPARLEGRRGEARVEVTLHKPLGAKRWRVFAKPGKRLRVGDNVLFGEDFSALVVAKQESGEIDLEWQCEDWQQKLAKYGRMPLPQYIKRESELIDNNDYQTIYASKDGAVAAPTAGLHFTKEMLAAIDAKDIKRVYVTLHVGAGTFQPVKAEDTAQHVMHTEYAEISRETADSINAARKAGGRIVAVGTTSLRTLESAADDKGQVMPISGETGIFITPGYVFRAADILMTNFHLPRSTLFMLVSAFMGLERMKEVYAYAIGQKYRFYSYGDASILFPRKTNL